MTKAAPDSASCVTRRFTVLAQDPSVCKANGAALTTCVETPGEMLMPGPRGHRISVIDFDATAKAFYPPGLTPHLDAYATQTSLAALVADPHFHAQNVYALAANTLLLFERALGRHVSWGFPYGTHELKILPHAFADQNAYYSRRDEGLLFGYFDAEKETIYTCLSRDIVVHETTHALLDGLKPELSRPSSYDQAAFHEGYSDVIAILSVLASEELLIHQLDRLEIASEGCGPVDDIIQRLTQEGFLFGIGEQFGAATNSLNRNALRHSAKIPPDPNAYRRAPKEAHDRGEIFVAPILAAYIAVWRRRLTRNVMEKAHRANAPVELWRVAEEGATAAQHLLRICIRALDYLPPAHVEFGDFLSAALTADKEACPDDHRYDYRDALKQAFESYGVKPAAHNNPDGAWDAPPNKLDYRSIHLDALRTNPEAVYRFVHDNRKALRLVEDAMTKVSSVRPVMRVGEDGFVLHETVAEYFQIMSADAATFTAMGLKPPSFLDDLGRVWLHGGGSLIFDETGRLKFHIHNRLDSAKQLQRLKVLWKQGALRPMMSPEENSVDPESRRFAKLHAMRALSTGELAVEEWP